jgi:hypothetical protein
MFGLRSRIQGGELLIQLRGMARLNSSLRAGKKKLLDPLMPEAANHSESIVPRNVTLHNSRAAGYRPAIVSL